MNYHQRSDSAAPAGDNQTQAINRRHFLVRVGASAISLAVLNPKLVRAAEADRGTPTRKKVVVGGHPWVYAATQPNYDITPVLPAIFEDMSYAGLDGIELMDTALLPQDAVERIGELSKKHHLPVIGMSFGGAM